VPAFVTSWLLIYHDFPLRATEFLPLLDNITICDRVVPEQTMTGQELQQGENAKKRVLAGHPRARFLLIAALALLVVVAAILLFLPWYMRPIARVNRMLADFGLAPIPASRTELDMQLGETTYVRFSADPNTIARYVSHASDVGEPGRGGMPRIQVDSKRGRPSWFRPAMSPSGRNYVSVSGGKLLLSRPVMMTSRQYSSFFRQGAPALIASSVGFARNDSSRFVGVP